MEELEKGVVQPGMVEAPPAGRLCRAAAARDYFWVPKPGKTPSSCPTLRAPSIPAKAPFLPIPPLPFSSIVCLEFVVGRIP